MLVKSNGCEIYYVESGTGAPLVLVHGYPLDHSIWEPVLPYLGQGVRAITPDLRGFGRSGTPQGTATIGQMADDLAGLLEALGITQAAIAGHSMGGYVALAFAHAYPQRLTGLALINSQAGADTTEGKQTRIALAERVRTEGPQAVAQAFVPKLSTDARVQASLTEIVMRTPPAGLIAGLQAMAARPDASPWLAEIDVPCLVISGSADQVIPRPVVVGLVNQLKNCRWEEISSAGHMPMMEAPQAVGEAIRQWLIASPG
jgi:pimeloyl-ACP methyl ester carboxylesterase